MSDQRSDMASSNVHMYRRRQLTEFHYRSFIALLSLKNYESTVVVKRFFLFIRFFISF